MILCYHAIRPGASEIFLPREEFARHCAWLARHRTVRPLDEVAEYWCRTKRFRRRHVALTFDDGYRDNLEDALPVMQAHGLTATVFLVAGALLGERPVDWIADQDGPAPPMLSPDDVREMARSGIDFGAHTWSHPDVRGLDDGTLRFEMRRGREAIEDVLGRPGAPSRIPSAVLTPVRDKPPLGRPHAVGLPAGAEPTGRYAVPRVGVYRGVSDRLLALKTRPTYIRAEG